MLDPCLAAHFLKKTEGIDFDGGNLLHSLAARSSRWWATGGQDLLDTAFERGLPFSALLQRDPAGSTPLHTACQSGSMHGVQRLLAKAQELLVDRFPEFCNARDDAGRTPLIVAAEKGREDVVCMLLQVPETDANILDIEGRLAVHWAGSFKWDTVRKLLDCCLDCDVAATQWVLDKGLPNNGRFNSYTALIGGLIAKKNTAVLRRLLCNGPFFLVYSTWAQLGHGICEAAAGQMDDTVLQMLSTLQQQANPEAQRRTWSFRHRATRMSAMETVIKRCGAAARRALLEADWAVCPDMSSPHPLGLGHALFFALSPGGDAAATLEVLAYARQQYARGNTLDFAMPSMAEYLCYIR